MSLGSSSPPFIRSRKLSCRASLNQYQLTRPIKFPMQIHSLYNLVKLRGGGVTHMLRHTGMCRPNGLLFYQKSLDMGPTLVKKIRKRWVPFHKICKKNCKISRFWGRKTLRNGSRFGQISKKLSIQLFFEWEKSSDMGRGFRPRAAHSVKK